MKCPLLQSSQPESEALQLAHYQEWPSNLSPEVFVESTGDHAALEESDDPALVALGDLEVQVLPPVSQLASFQRLHVEVGPLNLKGKFHQINCALHVWVSPYTVRGSNLRLLQTAVSSRPLLYRPQRQQSSSLVPFVLPACLLRPTRKEATRCLTTSYLQDTAAAPTAWELNRPL